LFLVRFISDFLIKVGVSANFKMEDEKKARWMSIGEAAKYLGISRDTLRRWEKRGRIKPVRSPTNRRYYTKELLDRTMDRGTERGGKKPKGKPKRTASPKMKKGLVPALVGLVSFLIAVAIAAAVLFFLL
jgi:excisionase family DNA binding protein